MTFTITGKIKGVNDMTITDALVMFIVSVGGGYCGGVLYDLGKGLIKRFIEIQVAKANSNQQ